MEQVETTVSGVKYDKDVCLYNRVGILIHRGATVTIGNHFRFVGGDIFNPLSGRRGG